MKNKLLQLFRDNVARPGNYAVRADGDEARINIYEPIGGWFGIEAEQFANDLNAITAPVIHLHINSPGGDVFDGRAMATNIRQHPSKVIAHIDGLAASAATYVALAANEVEIADGAFFMIHNAWTIALGNAADMRDTAELLDKVDGSISADYQRKTGAGADQIADWMAAETWFTAAEALEHGFVDRIAEDAESAPENASHWNLAAYANTPAALVAPPKNEPQYDRARMERRLALLERTAA